MVDTVQLEPVSLTEAIAFWVSYLQAGNSWLSREEFIIVIHSNGPFL